MSPSIDARGDSEQQKGIVYLVGAGPGHPGLITLRGIECLGRADDVLYDYLVNPRILDHASPGAECICLGKHGRTRIWTQAEINERMVELASAGRTVVRLKSGDPTVFARIAEETEALTQAEIPYEIVPGVTAAIAAGAFADIPLTHGDRASAAAVVTGQERADKAGNLDFDALSQFPGTLVFYMGVVTSRRWTTRLIDAGKSADTPCAIIRRCSWPDQQTIPCRLDEVADRIEADRLRPPVIVVIGDVAESARQPSWFQQRPLFGQRVLVTRPADQAEPLAKPLREAGAEVLFQPAITVTPAADPGPLDETIRRLGEFDWVVFSSRNGVDHLLARIRELGGDLRDLAGVKIAAVGPSTSKRLNDCQLRVDCAPTGRFQAEDLAAALSDEAPGRRMLLIRGSRGREVLGDTLRKAGAEVEQVVAYQSADVPAAADEILATLADGKLDWVTVTSSAIACSAAALFGKDLARAKLASISPITSATLRELGHEPAVEAAEYTMTGLARAIVDASANA